MLLNWKIQKNELEKAKSQFLRYSEKQFELYNDLWKVLLYTKRQADLLWQKANKPSIHKRLAAYRAMMPKKTKDKVKNRHQEQSR